jgi:hypothetical protein
MGDKIISLSSDQRLRESTIQLLFTSFLFGASKGSEKWTELNAVDVWRQWNRLMLSKVNYPLSASLPNLQIIFFRKSINIIEG